MGCTGSTNALPPIDCSEIPSLMANGIHSNQELGLPSSVAFMVPLQDQEENLVKKHPPKRFQRLEERRTSPPEFTLKMLQDKLAEAERRRLQILNERIESAKIFMRPKYANGNAKSMNDLVSQTDTPRIIEVEG